jgi:outer membrane murein-binding lipoprotein Lpp
MSVFHELPRAADFGALTVSISEVNEDLSMNQLRIVKAAVVAAAALLAGCQDLKPLQTDISDLSSQVARLRTDVQGVKASSDQAGNAAQAATQAANEAQSKANQALAAAQSSQAAVDAVNEKIDRMFKHKLSK